MRTQEELLQLINTTLERIDLDGKPTKLYAPIRYVLSIGGKRIRPVLCLMACELFEEKAEEALQPAIALEVFHNFTLLHDDIMDKALKRRNNDCVHIKWDENVAILSGDAMQILAYDIFCQLPKESLKDCLSVFSKTALEVCEGQQYDMDFETQETVDIEDYLKMIRLKTAVLLAASLKIGATIGGASLEDAERLYRFGIETGFAFQLKDDLLDVYGDSGTFGKNIGGDIVCNKKTFLLIEAFRRADETTAADLRRWLNATHFDPAEKIRAVTEIYDRLNVQQACLAEIEKHQKTAFAVLEQIAVPPDRKKNLYDLACELMDRKN